MKLVWCFGMGLIFGSFANVFFHRYPEGLSVWKPRSRCPSCSTLIPWFDNIPLISFLILRGKCRSCRAPISWRYPLVEAACGILFLALGLRFDVPWILVGFLWFFFLMFLAGGTDLVIYFKTGKEYGIIPDSIVLLLAVSGLAFAPWNPLLGKNWWAGLAGGIGGALFLWTFRWAGEKILRREALGLGDVKLAGAIGLWMGWTGLIGSLIVGSLLGSALGLALIAGKKLDRRTALPFGPFLAIGSLSVLLYL